MDRVIHVEDDGAVYITSPIPVAGHDYEYRVGSVYKFSFATQLFGWMGEPGVVYTADELSAIAEWLVENSDGPAEPQPLTSDGGGGKSGGHIDLEK